MNNPYRSEDGFTLLELAVVVLIMGILASIAVPALLNQRRSAVDSVVKSDIANTARTLSIEAMDGRKVTAMTIFNSDGLVGNEPSPVSDSPIWVTEGTTIIIQPSAVQGGLCVFGVNTDGNQSAMSPGFVYDSLAGGLLGDGSKPAACADHFGNLNVPQAVINAILTAQE